MCTYTYTYIYIYIHTYSSLLLLSLSRGRSRDPRSSWEGQTVRERIAAVAISSWGFHPRGFSHALIWLCCFKKT